MLNNQLTAEEKNWGVAAHLTALCGFVIPFGNIVGPLVVWLAKKEISKFVNEQGKDSLNFQITWSIYIIIAFLLGSIVIGFSIMPIVVAACLILTIIGGIKAANGETYRYPATLRFIN